MTTSHEHRTVATAYAAARNDIARLLDVLQMELDAHAERFRGDPRNWGYAGSVQKLRSDLINAVAFIANMDRPEVERFLDEAE
jgi:hypothetical protein